MEVTIAKALALVSALFILAMWGDVLIAFRTILSSSLGSPGGIAQTLNKVSPILLGSTAVMLAYRGGFFNIGVDGQIYVGAIATTGLAFLAAVWPVPGLLLPSVLLAGLVGGAVFRAIPGVLRARWGVSEIFRHCHAYVAARALGEGTARPLTLGSRSRRNLPV